MVGRGHLLAHIRGGYDLFAESLPVIRRPSTLVTQPSPFMAEEDEECSPAERRGVPLEPRAYGIGNPNALAASSFIIAGLQGGSQTMRRSTAVAGPPIALAIAASAIS